MGLVFQREGKDFAAELVLDHQKPIAPVVSSREVKEILGDSLEWSGREILRGSSPDLTGGMGLSTRFALDPLRAQDLDVPSVLY